MDREQKAAQIEELKAAFGEAEAIFAVDYRGISVPQAAELRASLREADAAFRIVKNRLAKLAIADSDTDGIETLLEGPTALTFVKGDPVVAAKAISTFSREHEVLEFKGGIMEGATLDPDQFKAIARLPALEVLHGQLAGLTASPLTGLVRGLGSMISGLAVALGQIQERGLVSGEAEPEAPAEDAPADDAAADETPAEDASEDAGGEEGAESEEPAAESDEPAAESEEPAAEETSEAEEPAADEAPAAEAEAGEAAAGEPAAEDGDGDGEQTETETEDESKEDQ